MTASTILNTAMLSASATASVVTAVKVNPGDFRSTRAAYRRSRASVSRAGMLFIAAVSC